MGNRKTAFTSVIGKLQVVIMEGKEIFNGWDSARTCGKFSDTVMFAGQDLHVVICQEKREKTEWSEKDGGGAETRTDRG